MKMPSTTVEKAPAAKGAATMKAVVFHAIGDIRLDDVPVPKLEQPTDAVVRLTATAICGTDLHLVRGTVGPVQPGTVMGHEGVGIIDELGTGVRNLKIGDRVIVASTIACGYCSYCRAGYYAQCDNANPNGKLAGTAYFGGAKKSGPFNGMQAEKVRVPFANVGLIKIPDWMTDSQAVLLSDIFPTGYFGADIAGIHPGDTVAVFGCGPVGQFAIASAKLFDAGRIIAVDQVQARLDMAREQGAEVVNFSAEDPVDTIRGLTGGIGIDRCIDAVGIDAQRPHAGPAAEKADTMARQFEEEVKAIDPQAHPSGKNWLPGDAPSQALQWEVAALDKAGTLSIIGVYPDAARTFPIGEAMGKNLTINMGNCNHRKYIPSLINSIGEGVIDPEKILTLVESFSSIIDAYKAFDERLQGWVKVELVPGM